MLSSDRLYRPLDMFSIGRQLPLSGRLESFRCRWLHLKRVPRMSAFRSPLDEDGTDSIRRVVFDHVARARGIDVMPFAVVCNVRSRLTRETQTF